MKTWIKRISTPEVCMLFCTSFLSLYLELVLIRWIPTNLKIFAYYSNLLLISALFGIGLGMIISTKLTRGFLLKIWGLLTLIVLIISMSGFSKGNLIPISSSDNFLWNGLSRLTTDAYGAYSLLVLIFLLSNALFICTGQLIGFYFRKLENNYAYSINLLGSISGVLLFSIISSFSTPPFLWFAVLSIILSITLYFGLQIEKSFKMSQFMTAVVALLIPTMIVFIQNELKPNTIWSPYYEISYQTLNIPNNKGEIVEVGANITVNSDSHQQALDLSNSAVANSDFLYSRRIIYDLPYQIYGKNPENVLILGAGSGNDTAAAIRADATMISAVEIDPEIQKLSSLHPENPYNNNSVSVYINDARAFIEADNSKYDIITYGYLDSHRLFSTMSSVRLENFLYTEEVITKLKNKLTPGGLLVITYTVHEKWIADRIFSLLKTTFDQDPLVYQGNTDSWGTVFLVRNGEQLSVPEDVLSNTETDIILNSKDHTWSYHPEISGYIPSDYFDPNVEIPTDNWPHLFMKSKGIPINYLAVLVLVSVFLSFTLFFKANITQAISKHNFSAMLLGAGFALIEIKGINEFALVIGSTWYTNVIIITAILCMSLLANIIIGRYKAFDVRIIIIALFILLIGNTIIPTTAILQNLPYAITILLGAIRISLPLICSGILFSNLLLKAEKANNLLGFNILGAMIGGVLEYMSLIGGFSLLNYMAILIYLFSIILYYWGKNSKQ